MWWKLLASVQVEQKFKTIQQIYCSFFLQIFLFEWKVAWEQFKLQSESSELQFELINFVWMYFCYHIKILFVWNFKQPTNGMFDVRL